MKKILCGVYGIRHKKSGKIYVGSTRLSLHKRMGHHRWLLRLGKHHNAYLQNSWNKYGEDAFEFVILERCVQPLCLKREQFYIDKLKAADARFGYNILPRAASLEGRKHTAETKAKMSATHKGRKFTKEHRENMSKCKKGIVISKASRRKISKSLRGRTFSELHRKSLADAWKRRKQTKNKYPMSNETKEKLAAANRGKKQSQVTIKRRVDAIRKTLQKRWSDNLVL